MSEVEKVDEFRNLMGVAMELIGQGEYEEAQEYLTDACYIHNQIQNNQVKEELLSLYLVNPYDFAQ
jgi:hypothetical protein